VGGGGATVVSYRVPGRTAMVGFKHGGCEQTKGGGHKYKGEGLLRKVGTRQRLSGLGGDGERVVKIDSF